MEITLTFEGMAITGGSPMGNKKTITKKKCLSEGTL